MIQAPAAKGPGFLGMPKLPVTGLFLRLVAFFIDLILILTAIHVMSRTFPDFFWALGEWSPYLTGTLFFGYFVLFNGPFGKGQTVGKLLMRISVTDLDGRAPTIQQALLRTAIIFPVFILVPIVESLLGPTRGTTQAYVKMMLTHFPFWAVVAANFLIIPFNPFKQGFHDFFAGTLVRPQPKKEEAPVTFAELTDQVGQAWPKFHRQPQYSGGVTFAIVYALLAWMANPTRASDEMKEVYARLYSLNDIAGFEKSIVPVYPLSEQYFMTLPFYQDAPPEILAAFSAEPTTGTVTLILPLLQEGTWKGLEQENDFYANSAMELLTRYRNEILPRLAEISLESDHEQVAHFFTDWMNSPLVFRAVLISQARLTPYPYSQQRIVANYETTFPPLREDSSHGMEEDTQKVE